MVHIPLRGRLRFAGLWRQPDFINLWTAETISQVGSQITLLALPLAAALSLDAGAAQMGLLAAAETLPALLFGLFAGAWVDRLPRRPLMVVADLGRAALLAIVPAAWFLDVLQIELLYVLAFLVGVLTTLFDVAYLSLLPSLVRRDQIIEANSKLQASASAAQVAGPGIAGILVGLITAPWAIAVDAVSFLFSALFLTRIRVEEARPEPDAGPADRSVRREIGEGLRVVWNHPLLRPMTLTASTNTLFGFVFLSVYVLYMVRDLGFGPGSVGLVLGLGGVGALLGAFLAEPFARRIGVGPAIVLGRVLFGVGGLAVVAAFSVPGYEVPLVLFAEFFQWLVLVVADVNQVSLRQSVTPDRLLGRVNATTRFAVAGVIPIGSLLGGLLGETIGLRGALLVGVFGMLGSCVFVFFSPLRSLHELPEHAEDGLVEAEVDLSGVAV
jgi:MFS family permease